jgi:hypothetical protein
MTITRYTSSSNIKVDIELINTEPENKIDACWFCEDRLTRTNGKIVFYSLSTNDDIPMLKKNKKKKTLSNKFFFSLHSNCKTNFIKKNLNGWDKQEDAPPDINYQECPPSIHQNFRDNYDSEC